MPIVARPAIRRRIGTISAIPLPNGSSKMRASAAELDFFTPAWNLQIGSPPALRSTPNERALRAQRLQVRQLDRDEVAPLQKVAPRCQLLMA
jgi:hypothetical protein